MTVIIHLIFVFLASVSFAMSFIFSLLFLAREFELKNHRPLPPWLRGTPPLEVLDSLHYKILVIGFLLLSVGILSGAFLSHRRFGVFFSFDLRQIASLVTWGIYAVFLNVRIRAGWRGRRGMLLSVLGFITVMLTFLATHHQGV